MKNNFFNKEKPNNIYSSMSEHKQSKAYSKYYEDYNSYAITKNGKKRIKIIHVYEGTYHYLKDGKKSFNRRKAVYSVLWIAALILFVFAATRSLDLFLQKPTVILQLFTVLAMGWCFIDALSYIFAPFNMTEYAIKSFGMLKVASYVESAMLCANVLLVICYVLFTPAPYSTNAILSAVGFLGAAVLALMIGIIEKSAVYESKKSTDKAPEGATKII